MLAVSETLNLGCRMGMDPKVLSQIINTSSGRCWSSEVYNPVPGEFEWEWNWETHDDPRIYQESYLACLRHEITPVALECI